jgi:hypothetical protein
VNIRTLKTFPAGTAEGNRSPDKKQDESVNGASPTPDPVIKQAKRDLDAGLVDTDMRATPGLDAKQRAKLVPSKGRKT